MLLSLFCGAGGLDLGFEYAGFRVGLAFDLRQDSIESYNKNRPQPSHGFVADIRRLTPLRLNKRFGAQFAPVGVIGGPPCQSFSQANVNQQDDDPRDALPVVYASLVRKLNKRQPIDFFVLENVVGLTLSKHRKTLERTIGTFDRAGFEVTQAILDAQFYDTPQTRQRLFLVGYNRAKFGSLRWIPPKQSASPPRTVRDAIQNLPMATFFERGLNPDDFLHHPNHWCMRPKSKKFLRTGALAEGNVSSRSFKTLAWDKPSIAVAYGHREVHIHPAGSRRLSVYEAMRLQGFPHEYRLFGNLSSQITQVSEAVPPPLGLAVARSIQAQLGAVSDREDLRKDVVDFHGAQGEGREPGFPRGEIVAS